MAGAEGGSARRIEGLSACPCGPRGNARFRGPEEVSERIESPVLGESALTSETPRTVEAGQVAEEVPLLCSLGLSSSLPALFPLKSWDREEQDPRAEAVAASTEPRGHFAKGDAKQLGKHAGGHLKGTRHTKRKREESVGQ